MLPPYGITSILQMDGWRQRRQAEADASGTPPRCARELVRADFHYAAASTARPQESSSAGSPDDEEEAVGEECDLAFLPPL